MKVTTEISSLLSSYRFYTVELDSIFGLSSSIQTSLTDELNRGESKLVCIKLAFLYCRTVKLISSIKMATDSLEAIKTPLLV